MDEGMQILLEQVARQAWQPTLGNLQVPDGQGGYHVSIVPQESPLIRAVAGELAKAIVDDPEIKEIFMEVLRQVVTDPSFVQQVKQALPHLAMDVQQRGDFRRAHVPDWVKEAMKAYFTEWLMESDDSSEFIERALANGTVTVSVERAAAEARR